MSRRKLGREISPVNFIHAGQPPILIVHGDADKLVPLYQAQIFKKRCDEVQATCKVIVREGKEHGWAGMDADMRIMAQWFDQYLRGLK